jgi:hypothetical protein
MATRKLPDWMTNLRPFVLEQAYIVFALIYFPVSFLFQGRGRFAAALLALYTFVMLAVGVVLIVKFVYYLARSANQHSGRYGSVFVSYILDAFIPLVMFKFFFITLWNILTSWPNMGGCWCQFVDFVKGVYFLYDMFGKQTILTNLIIWSLAAVGLFTLWSVGKREK